jgi:hypothetical protein
MPSNTVIRSIENTSDNFSDGDVLSVLRKNAGSGPFGGGCMIVAQALQQIYGGRIWVLIGRWSQQAEHAVLKVGDIFYDAAGAAALERIISRFSETAGVKIQSARPIAPGDLPEASRSWLAATEVAHLLRR